MSDNLVKVEDIIYGSYVKMSRLAPITINTFSNTSIASATNLNVFIDLYSVLKSIFSNSHRTDITDYTAITSGVINMCSHYRAFFKQLSVSTKFFLVFSFNTCDINSKFVAEYNLEFKGKSQIPLFNRIAMDNFELMDMICPYLPDIFFVKSSRNYESAVMMAHIIEMLNDGQPNLIISRDIYPMQLCYLYPYTSYLYPIKRKGGIDESVMVPISEKYNFRKEFWDLVANVRHREPENFYNLSPVNFPLLMALSSFPERNLKMLTNISATRKVIQKFAGSEDIVIPMKQLYDDPEISSSIPVSLVESRLKALDVRFMLPYYRQEPEARSITFKNLKDDAAINNINARFFAHNPLDLNKL